MSRKTLSANLHLCSRSTVPALCISTALGLSAPAVLAQETATTTNATAATEVRTYNIPAQPLSEALIQFGQQSGLQVTTNSGLVKGKQASAVKGSMTAQQALSQLLAGTGLRYGINGGMVSLEAGSGATTMPEAGSGTTILPALTVSAGSMQNSTLLNLDEPTQVGKLGVSLHETPISISVVDEEFIRESGAKNIQEALAYSPGVHSGNSGFSTRADWITVRGIDDLIVYRDGLRRFDAGNGPRTDVYSLERIEVLKGPSTALYGQGGLGGLLNTVSKLPKTQAQHEIWLQAGNFDRFQVAADSTGPLTSDHKWLYRVVALGRKSDTQVDFVNDDSYFVAPSLTWKPSARTTLTLLLDRQENDSIMAEQFLPAKGTLDPAPRGRIPTDTFVGEPDWDRYDTEKTEISLFFEHAFSDTWRFSAKARQSYSSLSFRSHRTPFFGGETQPDDEGNITRIIRTMDAETDIFNIDARIAGAFDLGPTHHKVAIGADYLDALTELDNFFLGMGLGGSFNLYDPVYGNIQADVVDPFDINDNEIKQIGLYAIDHVTLGNLSLTIALRRDDFENTQLNVSGPDTVSEDEEFTWQAGLMYRFDNGIAPYISYAEAFSPNLGTDGTAESNILKPTTGTQKEAGIKYLSPEGDLSVTGAYYEIEQENRVSNGITPGGITQIGADIKGWELEVAKSWRNLQVQAGYTNLDARDEAAGTRVPHVPEELASLWGQYEFPMGLRIGAGVRYKGDIVGAGDGPLIPSVTLYDAMLGYSIGHWDFSINGRNITDKTYIARCRAAGEDCFYGDRLTVTGNVRYLF